MNRSLAVTTRLLVAVVLVVLTGAAVGWLYGTRPRVAEADPEALRQDVVVMRAQAIDVQRQWRGYGTVEALDSADVPARITATVAEVPSDVLAGASVTAGQTLVKLDDADFVRELEVARRRLEEIDALLAQLDVEEEFLAERLALEDGDVAIAQNEYDRQVSLRERGVNNPQDVDAAQRKLLTAQRSRLDAREAIDLLAPRRRSLRAQRASQQAQIELAELSVRRATITSPIDGVLQSVEVEVGESVTAGERVARVVSMERVQVPLSLPGAAQGRVRVGDRVELRPTTPLPSLPVWETTVSRIAPEKDTATRTVTVFSELRQDTDINETGLTGLLVPGMFLEGVVHVSDVEPRFVVPRRAIRGGRLQVVSGGAVVSREVEVLFTLTGPQPVFGLRDDQWAVLEDGALMEGDLVVVNAATRLSDGAPVSPVLPDGARPGGDVDAGGMDTPDDAPAGAGALP